MHAGFLAVKNASPYGADKDLQRHCEQLLESLQQFQQDFRRLLPAVANEAVDRFMSDAGSQIRGNTAGMPC